ncbi:hypothetical protein BAUCODRAFT_137595 [Baudoinia panamericana UAMH 10762]|uniref:Uncharacterized protein n=1 Tax=Baudoinia panamericana (strain UAMH 10762) TaxID=717646 RepID=M2MRE9_BAUPA|nr:uncharacterized protein BAUCODRAFT_137595 [Baudoinia panamericana UAMH 10762]EMC99416.1 hypothetical protein BAUCODRAFT_137595 [Baudoinia panamericana UAMH 10762]
MLSTKTENYAVTTKDVPGDRCWLAAVYCGGTATTPPAPAIPSLPKLVSNVRILYAMLSTKTGKRMVTTVDVPSGPCLASCGIQQKCCDYTAKARHRQLVEIGQ